jgi:hypothetical protein
MAGQPIIAGVFSPEISLGGVRANAPLGAPLIGWPEVLTPNRREIHPSYEIAERGTQTQSFIPTVSGVAPIATVSASRVG